MRAQCCKDCKMGHTKKNQCCSRQKSGITTSEQVWSYVNETTANQSLRLDKSNVNVQGPIDNDDIDLIDYFDEDNGTTTIDNPRILSISAAATDCYYPEGAITSEMPIINPLKRFKDSMKEPLAIKIKLSRDSSMLIMPIETSIKLRSPLKDKNVAKTTAECTFKPFNQYLTDTKNSRPLISS